jgi:2-polyprenyl-3-methyl-5-hydroxy-6-metoxy-1,4-benzoquinol methylase
MAACSAANDGIYRYVSDSPEHAQGGHLDHYVRHGISPVRYRMDDLAAHLDRRDSLYRTLGLPPIAFRDAAILEVAPGSGQNSLYLATCRPTSLTLIEPNPVARDDIAAAYAGLPIPHTAPTLVASTLQKFAPGRQFDVVICENWLGGLPHEVVLIQKLASLVAPGGVMVLTIVPLAGFFANVMRKLLALRIAPAGLDFEARTAILVEVFGPHLATIPHMTRTHRDWVQDCMLNPHYLNVGLPLETVLGAIGGDLEALATCPRFANDWRWFKGLAGANRRFNEVLTEASSANLHTLVDHRSTYQPRSAAENQALHVAFGAVHALARSWQAAFAAAEGTCLSALTAQIAARLRQIEVNLHTVDSELAAAVAELEALWSKSAPTQAEVRDMPNFGPLFGRETVYLSLTRPRGG